MPERIYCAGSNERFMRIARDAGYLIGVCSGRLDYGFPVHFVDIHYRQANFEQHLLAVARYQPTYAIVPDLSEVSVSERDVARAIEQAEQLAQYCEIPLIVPKLSGQLALIPSKYAIAYSVPTSYGGAKYGVWKLQGRRVHLLGGSPHAQMKLYRYLPDCIQSADGNMAQKMATRFAKYWYAHQWLPHPQRKQGKEDLYLECWQWSCANIADMWEKEGVASCFSKQA